MMMTNLANQPGDGAMAPGAAAGGAGPRARAKAQPPEVLGAGVQRVTLRPLPGTELGRQVRTTRGRGANRGPCRVTAPTAGPEQCGPERDPHSGRLGRALLATPWTPRLCEVGLPLYKSS